MTLTDLETVRVHPPRGVWITEGLLIVLGVTALAGGAGLVFGLGGGQQLVPAEWLESLPLIHSWVVPGLVLGIGFGLGSLFVAYGMIRQPDWGWTRIIEDATGHHWSWIGTILIGVGHIVWIGLELVYLPFSFLHPLYGAVGVALVLLPLLPSVRRALRVR